MAHGQILLGDTPEYGRQQLVEDPSVRDDEKRNKEDTYPELHGDDVDYDFQASYDSAITELQAIGDALFSGSSRSTCRSPGPCAS